MTDLELNKRLAKDLGYFISEYHQNDGVTNLWVTKNNPDDNKDTPYNQLGWRVFNVITSAADREAVIEHYKIDVSFDSALQIWMAYILKAKPMTRNEYITGFEGADKDRTTAIINCFKKIVENGE